MIIGGADAPTPADGTGYIRETEFPSLVLRDMQRIDDGVLLHWSVQKRVINRNHPFFASVSGKDIIVDDVTFAIVVGYRDDDPVVSPCRLSVIHPEYRHVF